MIIPESRISAILLFPVDNSKRIVYYRMNGTFF